MLLEHPEFHCLTFHKSESSSLLENSSPEFNFDSRAKHTPQAQIEFPASSCWNALYDRTSISSWIPWWNNQKVFFSSPFVQLWAAAGQKKIIRNNSIRRIRENQLVKVFFPLFSSSQCRHNGGCTTLLESLASISHTRTPRSVKTDCKSASFALAVRPT